MIKLCLYCKKQLSHFQSKRNNKYCSLKCAYNSPLRLSHLKILSDEDLLYMKQHYNIDKSLEEIAKELGKDKIIICNYAKKLGLTSGLKNKNRRNKVLSDEVKKRMSSISKANIKKYGHPRGMLGRKHTNKTKKVMSQKSIGRKMPVESVDRGLATKRRIYGSYSATKPENIYSRTKSGWREFAGDKKYFMRSTWEMNYACYLDYLVTKKQILEWLYEPDTFWFEEIRRGVRSYKPDFKIKNIDGSIEYHEVKGWMDSKSNTKMKRMKKYYPNIKLILIDKDAYNSIKKYASLFGFTESK